MVSLSHSQELRPDRLYVPPGVPISDALEHLPKNWYPDFFWDPQVLGGHYLPVGLGDVNFPTIVSFVHNWYGERIQHLKGMFDAILPSSKTLMHHGTHYEPWGLSWGTQDHRMSFEEGEKKYACAFTLGTTGSRGTLAKVVEGRVVNERLDYPGYCQLLADSRAAFHMGDWCAPMTYRPLEIAAAGTVLINVDERADGSECALTEFVPEHLFCQSSMETAAQDIERAQEMDPEPLMEFFQDYTYEKQYERLFNLAEDVAVTSRVNTREWSRRAYAIHYHGGHGHLAGIHRWATEPDDPYLWHPEDKRERELWRKGLALPATTRTIDIEGGVE